MDNVIYVDNSSTTKLNEKVLAKMLPYLKEYYGNASTVYKLGKISTNAIEQSRNKIAKILNVKSEEIYFTASGTEADNMAIEGIVKANKGKHIITSKIEHLAVLNCCKKLEDEGYEVTYLDVGENGIVDIGDVKEAIRDDTVLISIMYANNEIGTIQPVNEIADLAREKGIYFHTDAVQAIPHMKIDASKYDALSISAHKFNGPKGVGVLYLKDGIKIKNIIEGGHQEKGIRPGTENVAGIVGTAEALELTMNNLLENEEKIKRLQKYFIQRLNKELDCVIYNGDMDRRLHSNINISLKDIDIQEVIPFLELNNIYASSGSACNSGIKNISHVIKAIGKNSMAIRFTLSSENTFFQIDKIVNVLKNSINIIKSK